MLLMVDDVKSSINIPAYITPLTSVTDSNNYKYKGSESA